MKMKKRKNKPRTKNLHFHTNNRISSLPDEILVMILSHLPIHQSIQTTILSRRWKNLWTLTTTIDFESRHKLFEGSAFCLNGVLESHRGPALTRLRIHLVDFALSHVLSCSKFLAWIHFAIRKSVQELELELDLIKIKSFQVLGFPRFDSLTTLSLINVGVEDSDVEYFCSQCPSLGTLRLIELGCVLNLKILSESLVSLEVSSCLSLRSLRVSATKLVSFAYGGPDREIIIEHAPLLSKVSFCEAYCICLVNRKFERFERVFPQLRTLKLTMSYPWITVLPKLDGLMNLKNLELDLKVWDCDHPFSLCASVIRALPFLHRFSLHLFKSEDEDCKNDDAKDEGDEDGRHHWLKVVEFLGFTGCWLDFRIIQFVIRNAASLQKMSVVPRRQAWTDSDGDVMQIKEKEEARKRAHLLEKLLSPDARLFVL